LTRGLFIGVTPNKNLPRTLEALTGLAVHLSIVGEPGEEMRRKVRDSGISHDISHGLTQEEIARKYAESDMVLFPSLYEGFGLPILEGFRSGRPVVTSSLRPMADVAGGAACLVDPLDSQDIRRGVLHVCRDRPYREELVRRGLERVRAFEPSRIAEAYLALYGRLSLGRTHPETAP
jgi:glycosyltransferase involved in cell wall biosynthesis